MTLEANEERCSCDPERLSQYDGMCDPCILAEWEAEASLRWAERGLSGPPPEAPPAIREGERWHDPNPTPGSPHPADMYGEVWWI